MVIQTGLDHDQIIVRFPMPILGADGGTAEAPPSQSR